MKIFITGGTGFVGTNLTKRFLERGYEVSILTRKRKKSFNSVSYIHGDPTIKGDWQKVVEYHDIVINLVGEPIFGRWSRAKKEKIKKSRLLSTKNLVEALKEGQTLFSASAVGYYGPHGDEELDENTPPGNDFLSLLAKEWESRAMEAEEKGVSVVVCRFGVVLGREGGIFRMLLPISKIGLISPIGSGRQWFSWIHKDDLVSIFLFLIDNRQIKGPLNCTSPEPIRNKEMVEILAGVFGRKVIMPSVPVFLLRLLMGEFGSIMATGQRVIPKRLLSEGFVFRFPTFKEAVENIIKEE
ncbi:MAG: TIGR01777 family protein [Nitrospirae bacterium]|nr:MAG: TIGR01777 family protein [Nitrospirota bacterium]